MIKTLVAPSLLPSVVELHISTTSIQLKISDITKCSLIKYHIELTSYYN